MYIVYCTLSNLQSSYCDSQAVNFCHVAFTRLEKFYIEECERQAEIWAAREAHEKVIETLKVKSLEADNQVSLTYEKLELAEERGNTEEIKSLEEQVDKDLKKSDELKKEVEIAMLAFEEF